MVAWRSFKIVAAVIYLGVALGISSCLLAWSKAVAKFVERTDAFIGAKVGNVTNACFRMPWDPRSRYAPPTDFGAIGARQRPPGLHRCCC